MRLVCRIGFGFGCTVPDLSFSEGLSFQGLGFPGFKEGNSVEGLGF